MELKGDGDSNCNRLTRYRYQRTGTKTSGLKNKSTIGDHANNSSVKPGQNNNKSPGDLRRLAVTQTPVKNH